MNTHSGIPRRTVVRGAAWSAPVITVAALAPAVAASVACGATRTGTATVTTVGVNRRVVIDGIGLPRCASAPAVPITVTLRVGRGTIQLGPGSQTTWTPPGGSGNPVTFTTVRTYSGGPGRVSLELLITGFPAGTNLSWSVSAAGYVTSDRSVLIP